MDKFYVLKATNTFSDSIEVLGLASILDKFFTQVSSQSKPEILIEDRGYFYQINVDMEIDSTLIEK
ncbi:MAG: hypothetical protein GF353_18255, partial [Candidatus Lokiarchaeota archaeon]|nr:hypothetical protein [Candidatus Lokiarchaeota archaeon]